MFCCLVRDPGSAPVPGALEAVARACSPRVEQPLHSEDAIVFDASGLTRMFGSPPDMAREIGRLAAGQGATVRVALANTRVAAWLLAHAQPGTTVVATGSEAASVAPLDLRWLRTLGLGPKAKGLQEILEIFARWGLRTLGDVARLPTAGLHARLGAIGVELHEAARGEDETPLVPAAPPRRFVERLELEWPIEGLEPLSFVLARLCDQLTSALARADRGAIVVRTSLRLVTRQVHERALHLPAPMGDPRVLRTLILLDLESHPPDAAIDVVELELDVAPGAIVQGSLLTRALPSSGDVATLVARLGALVGELRVGAPALVDTFDERQVEMRAFTVCDQGRRHKAQGRSLERAGAGHLSFKEKMTREAGSGLLPSAFCLVPYFRRFRPPLAARVEVERGAPRRVTAHGCEQVRGQVINRAGPWRSSGRWWALDRSDWDRDEWEVELASGGVYRIGRDRVSGTWEVDGVVD